MFTAPELIFWNGEEFNYGGWIIYFAKTIMQNKDIGKIFDLSSPPSSFQPLLPPSYFISFHLIFFNPPPPLPLYFLYNWNIIILLYLQKSLDWKNKGTCDWGRCYVLANFSSATPLYYPVCTLLCDFARGKYVIVLSQDLLFFLKR